MPSPYVLALVRERSGYQRDPRRVHRVIEVDQELAANGYGVNTAGELVAVAKTRKAADPGRPARERAVTKAPEKAVDD